MKKLFNSIGILLIGLMLIAGFSCNSTEVPPSGFKAYQNAEYGFRLYYPEHWQKGNIAGTVVYFTNPDIDEFQADIYVSIESSNDTTLEEYIVASKASVTYIFEDATLSNERSIEVQGRTGHEWVLSWTLEGIQLKMKQVFFITNGKFYNLNCTATEYYYDDYVDTFDTVINSFKIE